MNAIICKKYASIAISYDVSNIPAAWFIYNKVVHIIRSAHHLMGLIIACCASWQQWHVSLISYKLQQFASLCVDIIQTCRQQFQLRNLRSILYYRSKDVVLLHERVRVYAVGVIHLCTT